MKRRLDRLDPVLPDRMRLGVRIMAGSENEAKAEQRRLIVEGAAFEHDLFLFEVRAGNVEHKVVYVTGPELKQLLDKIDAEERRLDDEAIARVHRGEPYRI